MRTAQVMLSAGMGGAEGYFVSLCKALADRGHPVLAICDPRFVRLQELMNHQGVEVRTVRAFGAWDLLARFRIRLALKSFGAEIVHAHLARAARIGGCAARSLGIPAITKLHNYVNLKYYRCVDRFNVTTRSQREYLLSRGVASRDVVVIPNFSPMPVREPTPLLSGQSVVFVAYGRFVEKKGFGLLLESFSEVVRSVPAARLHLGGGGQLEPELRETVEKLNLGEHVLFSGWIEDVPAFLDEGDVFVLPSFDEPFGIVVLEAMARGLAIVSTLAQGPKEVLTGDMAWLVPVGDRAAMVRAMTEAALDESARFIKARRAFHEFTRAYSQEAVVPRLIEQYELLRQDGVRKGQAVDSAG